VQAPVLGLQQAPNRGHKFGVQAAAPFQVRGAVQAVCRTTVQTPVPGSQQAPGCGHGLLGEQLVQLPFQMLGDAQLTCKVTLQAPVGVQQAPGCGQGFGSHPLAGL